MGEPFDDSTKSFYRRLFERWGFLVETELSIFSRSRTIDIVVRCARAERVRLSDTVFSHFRCLNALELKGPNDPLTLVDYNRIMMRAWGLGTLGARLDAVGLGAETAAEKDHAIPCNRTVTIVCVTRPDKVLDGLGGDGPFRATGVPGIYRCDDQLPQWIIHPSELEVQPGNYPLLPLAKGEKLRQFIDVCLREGLNDYLELALDIGSVTDAFAVWQKMLEVKEMRPRKLTDETWQVIDQFFRISPEAPEKMPSLRDALEDSKRSGMLLAHQQTLLRLLRHKYGDLPPAVPRRVEATDDPELLAVWLERVLDARTLAEVGVMD